LWSSVITVSWWTTCSDRPAARSFRSARKLARRDTGSSDRAPRRRRVRSGPSRPTQARSDCRCDRCTAPGRRGSPRRRVRRRPMRRARSCRAHRQRQLVDVAHTRSRRYRVNSLPRDVMSFFGLNRLLPCGLRPLYTTAEAGVPRPGPTIENRPNSPLRGPSRRPVRGHQATSEWFPISSP